MTVRLPPDKIIDKILKIFGIRRKIILPSDDHEQSDRNPYVTIMAKKENFFATLWRTSCKYAISIFYD